MTEQETLEQRAEIAELFDQLQRISLIRQLNEHITRELRAWTEEL